MSAQYEYEDAIDISEEPETYSFKHEYEDVEEDEYIGEVVSAGVEDEYIGEVMSAEEELGTHQLLVRGGNSAVEAESYICLECNVEYASTEEFLQVHNMEEGRMYASEQQWEVVDDTLLRNAHDVLLKQAGIKSEYGAEGEEFEDVADTTIISEVFEEENDNKHLRQQQEQREVDEENWQALLVKQETAKNSDEETEHFEDAQEDSQKYLCFECKQVFGDLQSAEQHDCPEIGGSDEFEATNANEEATLMDGKQKSNSQAAQQQDNSENAVEYKCASCERVFGTLKALSMHSRTHRLQKHKQKQEQIQAVSTTDAVCTVCNTTFSSERNLKMHMKIHDKRRIKSIQEALPAGAKVQYNELNQFYCEICNKSFDENLLVVHKNMHQNVEEFNCRICNRQFENLPSYEMHMQMHEDNKTTTGHRPARTAKSKRRTETGKLSFPCQYCGHEFPRPHEKVKHERVHTGEKPYECEVCGKTFRVSYSLTLHLRTHTDIRPYVCATCNKRFKSQPVYAHHLKTHLTERPYKCDMCSKSFRTSVQLCGHKNCHKKPFICPECSRPFSNLYAVKIHMKTHSKLNRVDEFLKYRCAYCGAGYARTFALQTHIKEQHEQEEQAAQHTAEQSIGSPLSGDQQNSEDDILIAAAASADCASYIEAIANDADEMRESVTTTPNILSNEEQLVVDNFHTEEIVTEWLTQ